MRLFFGVIFFVCLLFLTAQRTLALTFRSDESIQVPQDERLSGSTFLSGSTIRVDGSIDGDLYCAGKDVEITGTVTGDVLCVAQTIRVGGFVGGSIRAAGQNLDFFGDVLRTISVAGQNITLRSDAVVDGDLLAAGSMVVVDGALSQGALVAAETFLVNGTINGEARIYAENFTIASTATLLDQVVYTGVNDPVVDPAARITIPISREKLPESEKYEAREREGSLLGRVFGILGSAIVATIFFILLQKRFPSYLTEGVSLIRTTPLSTLGIGSLVLFGTPLLALILLITVLGAGIGIVLLSLWVLMIVLSGIIPTLSVVREVSKRLPLGDKPDYLQFFVSALILSALGAIPLLGWMIGVVILLLGSGALVRLLLQPSVLDRTSK